MENKNPVAEEWRPVPNVSGYFVSNLGRVRNTARAMKNRNGVMRHYRERILSTFMSSSGKLAYFVAVPYGTPTQHLVHIAVAAAFLENPGRKCRVKHIDGNPYNCAVTNLTWGRRAKGWADNEK